ncbi:MAG: flavin-dependent oxidoreductase, F420-dependent methylene-tetrahydromethanopterin reductase [Ilumatobacteraceae bacterium]|nr:flavin-dependent oxidoreductase, F420-dependent methylene-tetrahydromethanopterin reductase [Ilumatobacteraceae bacterium]
MSAEDRPLPEIAWFGALCDDDYEQLGVADPDLTSSWRHCRDITLAADRAGFDAILMPSGYELGIDPVAFTAAVAPMIERITPLVAVRLGELWAPQLGRQLATLAQILEGRLLINIISSDLPGETLPSGPRYQRTLEIMTVLRRLLAGQDVSFHGEFVDLELAAPRITRDAPIAAPFYFGGLSPAARDVAAEAADVYLMWPDTVAATAATVEDLRARAAARDRELRFGFRVHVIVRETENEARSAARHLLASLDDAEGAAIRARSLDTASAGVARQGELREGADAEGFAEDHLWTGIGRARSGAGAAIVGDPDQVRAKLDAYRAVGIDAFILSGYPHERECHRFARLVLDDYPHGPLSHPGPELLPSA